MSAPDFSDWARPVATVEQDVGFGPIQTAPAGGRSGLFCQTNQVQTLTINVQTGNLAVGLVAVVITWHDQFSHDVGVDSFTGWSGGDQVNAGDSTLMFQVPVRGWAASVTLINTGNQSADLYVIGTTRPIIGRYSETELQAKRRLPVATFGVAVAAGATRAVRFGPYSGPFSFHIGTANTLIVYSLVIYDYWDPGGIQAEGVATQAFANGVADTAELDYPGMALEVQIKNNDTQQRLPGLAVVRQY